MRLTPLIILAVAGTATAGPIANAICEKGCAAAGFTFGTVFAATAPAAVLACNKGFGACQALCALVALAPTP